MFSIKKVEEGDTIPEQQLPINIQHKKLLDWIIDRKRLPNNWTSELEKLEQEIEYGKGLIAKDESFRDLLAKEMWVSTAEQILAIVNKNETGWIKSNIGRAWTRIVKHFRSKNLFLAHSARLLSSIVNYQIPALNKQIERTNRNISELDRKKTEYQRLVHEQIHKNKSECERLGIKGENIQQELTDLVITLPEYFAEIVNACQQPLTQQAVEFYCNFSEFILQSAEKDNVCPVLMYIYTKGNTSADLMEKFLAGEVSEDKLDEIVDSFVVVEEQSDPQVADGEVPLAAPGGINWDIDDQSDVPMATGQDINWDLGADGEDVPLEVGGEINWDLDMNVEVDIDSTPQFSTGAQWDFSVEDIGVDIEPTLTTQVSTQSESVLSLNQSRNRFVDDLYELDAFLRQRLSEMKSGGNVMHAAVLQNASANISNVDTEQIEEMASHVSKLVQLLENEKFQMIIEIKASSRYAERVAQTFKHRSDTGSRMETLSTEVDRKREDLQENILRVQLKKTNLINEAKAIKQNTEKELSLLYNNRTVNIMGDINNILS